MASEALLQALVDLILFIEMSDDSVLDPDAAVQASEQTADSLRRLSPQEKHQLLEYAERRAAQSDRDDEKHILRDLAEGFGL